jgi:hypothetical protein
MEVTRFALDRLQFGVGDNVDVSVAAGFNELRGQDTHSAVVCREGLIELRHSAADTRFLFDKKDLDPHLCQVKCRLNAGYPATNNHDCLMIHV